MKKITRPDRIDFRSLLHGPLRNATALGILLLAKRRIGDFVLKNKRTILIIAHCATGAVYFALLIVLVFSIFSESARKNLNQRKKIESQRYVAKEKMAMTALRIQGDKRREEDKKNFDLLKKLNTFPARTQEDLTTGQRIAERLSNQYRINIEYVDSLRQFNISRNIEEMFQEAINADAVRDLEGELAETQANISEIAKARESSIRVDDDLQKFDDGVRLVRMDVLFFQLFLILLLTGATAACVLGYMALIRRFWAEATA